MRIWTALALAAYLAALAFGVLMPDPPPVPIDPLVAPPDAIGLVADAIRNLVLFLPFGWLLHAGRVRPWSAAGLGLALSIAIELTQGGIPGRHTSVVDIVTNTLGTALGAALHATRHRWLRPAPEHAAWFSRAFGLLFAVLLMAGSQLLRPASGGPDFYAGWRPELGNYNRYRGAVLGARIGSTPMPPGRMADPEAFRRALQASAPISIRAEVDARAAHLAPLLIVHDTHQREILVVAAKQSDLVFAWRTRAVELGFERPIHRWRSALATSPKERAISLELTGTATGASLTVEGESFGCSSWRPGRLWSLLVPAELVPIRLLALFDASTIALLGFPCLYFARHVSLAAAILAAFLLALPWLAPIATAGWAEGVGIAGSVLLAYGARKLVRVGRLVCTGLQPSIGRDHR